VEAKGFKTMERQNILLEVGKEVQVDLTVQPGEQTQTVTVTESVPLVETTNATLGGTLNNSQIQDLPLNGRNYQYLLNLRPGVMIQPGGGPWTQSTNNIRPDESAWMVDGVINASFFDARPVTGASSYITDGATILPIDAIQEFNLEENPKAEYGWKPGAVVNVGIRSGTNSLHGAAYAFGREDSFDARNIFVPGPSNGTCLPNPAIPATCNKTPLQFEQFGAVVGGPIKKDKLFFFAGYEGLRDSIGNAFSGTTPALGSFASLPGGANATSSMVDAIIALQNHTPAIPVSPLSLQLLGCPTGKLTTASTCTGGYVQGASLTNTGYLSTFPNLNSSNNGIAKLDYRINSQHMINGMLWIGNYNSPYGEDHVALNPNWQDTAFIRNWTAVGSWVWTPSSTVVNELRFGYTRNGQRLLPFDSNVLANGTGYPINTGITTAGGFPTVWLQGFGQSNRWLGSWNGRPMENGPNPFYDVTDSVSYLKGKHSFKFGGEYGHIEADAFVHDTRGRIEFDGKTAFAKSTPLEDFFAGTPTKGRQLVGDAHRTLTWMNYAGFVQDDWRLTSKLILNLGLRYSYESPMKEANNLLGNFIPSLGLVQEGQSSVGNTIWKPDYRDFSPRLGFAWDVSGKGTTVVRGGASIIYSSFVAANFLAQAGINNFPGGSLGADPTGACKVAPKPVGTPCPAGQTLGGTITLGTVQYGKGILNWDPAITGNPAPVFPAGVLNCAKGCNLLAVDPNLHTPYITNWNLSVTRAFTNNLSLEVGYVGNHGTRLVGFLDVNQLDPASPAEIACGNCEANADRPYGGQFPYIGFINQASNYGYSNYNSLQATLTERVTHGLNFTAGYTYGHGLDDGSENRFGPLPQDSRNPRASYASGDFDVRNRFTLTTGYSLPGKKGFGQLLEGWKINSIVSVQSAQPWNIADTGNDFSLTGESQDRWDFFGNPTDFKSGANSVPYCTGFGGTVTCTSQSGIDHSVYTFPNSAAMGAQCTAVAPDPSTLATGGCFVDGNSVIAPPKAGTFGTMGRNIFRDNGFRNWDLSLFKTFTFKERYSAQFRVEFFDILNRATISNPSGANNGSHNGDDPSGTKTFGGGGQTPDYATGNPIIGSGSNRAMQLGLKLTF
jgi:hypothetical protein